MRLRPRWLDLHRGIQAGHDVTIFEALHKAGGVLVYGIPEFRLPKAVVRREVDHLVKLGVGLKTDFVVARRARSAS